MGSATGYSADFYKPQGGNAVHLPGVLGKGYIDLGPYLVAARELASAENIATGAYGVAASATPVAQTLSTGDPIFSIQWASANVDSVLLPPIFLPGDFNTSHAMKLGVYTQVGTATAQTGVTLDVKCRFGIGDTECGTAVTVTTAPTFATMSVATGDLTTDVLNIILTPSTHDAVALQVYGGRIEYTKKTS